MSIMSILSIMSIIFFSDVSKLYIIVCPDKNEQQFLFNFMLEGRDILHFISFHVMFFLVLVVNDIARAKWRRTPAFNLTLPWDPQLCLEYINNSVRYQGAEI